MQWKHVMLHCPFPRCQGMAGAVVRFLAGLGLGRDDIDKGTLLLSLKLRNNSIGVATSLAFFQPVLVTTYLLNTKHRAKGRLDRLAPAECESDLY